MPQDGEDREVVGGPGAPRAVGQHPCVEDLHRPGVQDPVQARRPGAGLPVAVEGPDAISFTPELLEEGEEAFLLERIGALAMSKMAIAGG